MRLVNREWLSIYSITGVDHEDRIWNLGDKKLVTSKLRSISMMNFKSKGALGCY